MEAEELLKQHQAQRARDGIAGPVVVPQVGPGQARRGGGQRIRGESKQTQEERQKEPAHGSGTGRAMQGRSRRAYKLEQARLRCSYQRMHVWRAGTKGGQAGDAYKQGCTGMQRCKVVRRPLSPSERALLAGNVHRQATCQRHCLVC